MATVVPEVEVSCPLCGGSGWRPEAVEDRPTPRVVPCECKQTQQLERRMQRAGIPKRFADRSFDTFRIEHNGDVNDSLSFALSAARRFVREYPMLNKVGLLFHGPCGIGKSHLAVAIVRELLGKNIGATYCNTKDLLQNLRYSFNPISQTSEAELLRGIIDTEVLVLDDLGAERLTDWVQETMYHVINSRYQADLTTLITTNLEYGPPGTEEDVPVSRLSSDQARRATRKETLGDRVGQRIWSRLTEMCRAVGMQGEDQRERLRRR
ncbi:MAG: ATP-binding protein [Acidobacteriales bacterium]|nr:ATP-binding protein [Terriglobales bacterium]